LKSNCITFKRINYNLLYRNIYTYNSNRRHYSTTNNINSESEVIPISVLTLNNLNNDNDIKSYRELLKNKGGIYSFVNTLNNKKYIGSAKDLYIRLVEHINNKKSNAALQKAFNKYGLDKFNFCVYEYFTYDSKIISHKSLTDLETSYIKKFNLDPLYNYTNSATSLSGYKHSNEAKSKMIKRYENKNNHPMFGKTQTKEALALISKPGKLNTMFGRKHSESIKNKISSKMNKHPLGVGIYDLDNNLISKFKNNVELAKYLNISRVTVGKYLNSGTIYKKLYYFKVIQD
jgi:group I intron endonuclease